MRYYTLQRAWQDHDSDFANGGFVDIFLHGKTDGSNWASSLKVGDIITSRSEHEEKCDHLHDGQALLIADETAFPTLLTLLQTWENPIAPFVVLVSAQDTEQAYFSDNDLQGVNQIHRLVCPPEQQSERIIAVLEDLPAFTTVWGAFEGGSAKTVRAHIRKQYDISGKQNRIKGYWLMHRKTV